MSSLFPKPKSLDESIAEAKTKLATEQERLEKVKQLVDLKRQSRVTRRQIRALVPSNNKLIIIILAIGFVVILAVSKGCKL